MGCKYCTPREGTDLCGTYAWDLDDDVDGNSRGRIDIWHDEDGYQFVVLVDGPYVIGEKREPMLRHLGVASLRFPLCPFCGREL